MKMNLPDNSTFEMPMLFGLWTYHNSGGRGLTPSHSYAPSILNQTLPHVGTPTAPPIEHSVPRLFPISQILLTYPSRESAHESPSLALHPGSCLVISARR